MRMRVVTMIACLSASVYGASLDVPFVRQDKQGCGAASVAMVMQYWANQGADLPPGAMDPSVIYRLLYDPKLHGSSGEAMADYLRGHAFAAFAIEARWSDLASNISRGRPVIVGLKPSNDEPVHFVVVIGLEQNASKILFHDPARRASVPMGVAPFEAEWRRTGNWALIATPERIK